MRIKVAYFHALCSPFLILMFGFVFPFFIHVLTLLMHREEIYVQKKKHTSKTERDSSWFQICTVTVKEMRIWLHFFRYSGIQVIAFLILMPLHCPLGDKEWDSSNFRGSISWTTRSGGQTLRGGSDNSPESQETSIRSRLWGYRFPACRCFTCNAQPLPNEGSFDHHL